MRTSNRFALNVERDSVCVADDTEAPHAKRFAFQPKDTLTEALSAIVEARYLANVARGKATWIVEAAGKPLAVVAQQWRSPKFLIKPTTLPTDSVTSEVP